MILTLVKFPMFKKQIHLFLVLAFTVGTAYAGFGNPLLVEDGDFFRDVNPADNIVGVAGTINPIHIDSDFEVLIVGNVHWFNNLGVETIIGLDEGALSAFDNADIFFHLGEVLGGDSSVFGPPTAGDFSGGQVPASDVFEIYKNVVHIAADAFTETVFFVRNNLGFGWSMTLDFISNGSDQDIWTVDTPTAGLILPIPDAFGGTYNGENDGPIHVIMGEAFDAGGASITNEPSALAANEEAIQGAPTAFPGLLDPIAVNALNTQVGLYDTNSSIGDNFTVFTVLDFVNLAPATGTFGGNILWTLDSKIP